MAVKGLRKTRSPKVVERGEPGYPPELERLDHPPKRLWLLGLDLETTGLRVAIVGARECSTYGRSVAGSIAQQLADRGICVVSGMARGVDAAAHWGALKATWSGNGPATIAVLGSGVDVAYPASNRDLYRQLAAGATVLSEFEPGTRALPPNFPARNRIIAALSRVVLITEAAVDSGSMHTVDFALALGLDVLAVPGSIFASRSRGCHKLIKSGAGLVETVDDVLDALGLADDPSPTRLIQLSGSQVDIMAAVSNGAETLDEIISSVKIDIDELLRQTIELEMIGAIRRLPGGRLEIVPGVSWTGREKGIGEQEKP